MPFSLAKVVESSFNERDTKSEIKLLEPRCRRLRLTPNKIEYLAGTLLKMFQENARIHITGTADLVTRRIEDIIYENMRQEEEIDEEVDTLIQKHKGEIQTLEMDMGALRNKFKREIAKKRGFIL
jgi:hypothetical protein